MCEFCTKHGDGKVWFENAANYANDLISDINRRTYIKDFFSSTIDVGANNIGRLEVLYQKKNRLPARLVSQMIKQAKKEHFGQVVTIEDIRAIVGKAATVVRLPCACCWASTKKENRCCYSVSYSADAWYADLDMSYFGLAQNSGLESLSPEVAIKQIEELEEDGAIHTIWTMMTPFVGAICNCQTKDCLGLRTLKVGVESMFHGEKVAQIDTSICNGCGLCEQLCQFGAIKSVCISGDDKAVVDCYQCYGCGLCRKCPQEAIQMVTK